MSNAYDLNIRSTADERYDGVIADVVADSVGHLVAPAGGGVEFMTDTPFPADNYYRGFVQDVRTDEDARKIAQRIADVVGRPVTYILNDAEPVDVEPATLAPLNRRAPWWKRARQEASYRRATLRIYRSRLRRMLGREPVGPSL